MPFTSFYELRGKIKCRKFDLASCVLEVFVMPLYEFQCEKCGSTTEMLISFKEADAEFNCEECGGKLKRVFSVMADARPSSGASSSEGPACSYGGG